MPCDEPVNAMFVTSLYTPTVFSSNTVRTAAPWRAAAMTA